MIYDLDKDKLELVAKIEEALHVGHDTHTLSDVVDMLNDGRMQMFSTDDSVCVTEICVAPRKKFLQIFLAAGNLDGLKSIQPKVVDFARKNGCAFIRSCGRLGWEKVATDGWKKTYVTHIFEI